MKSASVRSIVGRRRELDLLGGLMNDLASGAAATVLIEGEAGIGKTRLLEWLIDLAGRIRS